MNTSSQVKLASFLGITAGVTLAATFALAIKRYVAYMAALGLPLNGLPCFDPDAVFAAVPFLCSIALMAGSIAFVKRRPWGRTAVILVACLLVLVGLAAFLTFGVALNYPLVSACLGWGTVLLAAFNFSGVRESVLPNGRSRRIETGIYAMALMLALAEAGLYAYLFHQFVSKTEEPFHNPQKIVLLPGSRAGTVERRFRNATFDIPSEFTVGYVHHRVWPENMAGRFDDRDDDMLIIVNKDKSAQLFFSNFVPFNLGWGFGYGKGYQMGLAFTREKIGLTFRYLRSLAGEIWDDVEVGPWRGFRGSRFRAKGTDKDTFGFSLWHGPTGDAIEVTAMLKVGGVGIDEVQKTIASIRYSSSKENVADLIERALGKLAEGEFEDAKFDLATALLADWNNAECHYQMARAQFLSGKFGNALHQVGKALELRPDFSDALELKARAEEEQKKKSALEAEKEKAEEKDKVQEGKQEAR